MGIREARKQASRARVVEAARTLFEEIGFQETTIRMIAERAGLSPGGVFTTFEDKVAILCEIVGDYRKKLFDEMEALAAAVEGPVRQKVHQVLTLAHRHDHPRLRLVAAYVGASYGWSRAHEDVHRTLHHRLRRVIQAMICDGVANGEIRRDLDPELLGEMISAIYLRNYRTALYGGLSQADLDARTRRQLDLLFDGAAPR